MQYFIWFLTDILLGFVPQAAGCAVCLFAITNKKVCSRSFLYTSIIFSAIAIVVRLAYNYGIIDFGFHTVVIWMIFIVVAIVYNKFPTVLATVSILISGFLITVSELITCLILMFAMGGDAFNEIMNNTQTIAGKINKASCGIPANFLFLVIVIVLNFVLKRLKNKSSDDLKND